jgi:hypothetical protein
MKKLILSTLLVSTSLYAAGPIQEIASGHDANQIVAKIKDIQVTEMLNKTGEFNDCRKNIPM